MCHVCSRCSTTPIRMTRRQRRSGHDCIHATRWEDRRSHFPSPTRSRRSRPSDSAGAESDSRFRRPSHAPFVSHPGAATAGRHVPAMISTYDAWVEFRRLHESGCFVIPNPRDIGSARLLVRMGFRALATTSSGFAWSCGRADDETTLGEALEHFRAIAAAVDIPVSGDFQTAFAIEPEGVETNVALAAATGLAGVSVEDRTGNTETPLLEFELAVDRIRAARRAIDTRGAPVLLTARAEGFLVGRPDLAETIRRLKAFAEAGADCVYAPGVRAKSDIAAIVAAVSPTPVNVVVA